MLLVDHWSRVVPNDNTSAVALDGVEASRGDPETGVFQALSFHADSRGEFGQRGTDVVANVSPSLHRC